MAKHYIKNPAVTLNSATLTGHVREAELQLSRAAIDDTTSGAEGIGRLAGLKDEKVTLKFAQDYDESSVDATLWAIYDSGAAVEISIAGDAGDAWTGSVILTEYTPLTGAIGTLAEAAVTLEVDGILTRSS